MKSERGEMVFPYFKIKIIKNNFNRKALKTVAYSLIFAGFIFLQLLFCAKGCIPILWPFFLKYLLTGHFFCCIFPIATKRLSEGE